MKIVVLGAGSWGTAIAAHLARKNYDVTLWARSQRITNEINTSQTNHTYLPNLSLPKNLCAINEIKDLNPIGLVITAVPSFAIRDVLGQLMDHSSSISDNTTWVSLTKGMEYQAAEKQLRTMTDVISEMTSSTKICALSGPSFAAEVVLEMPTTVVLASHNSERLASLQNLFMTERFRVYTSDDVLGVELAGAFKNVIALAAGISQGLNMGDNARGALISRGLAEMSRLGEKLGARKETFFGLAGVGDTVISAMSSQSRNFQVGYRIGKGEFLREILDSMEMVAEGVYSTQVLHEYSATQGVELPITNSMYQLLFEDADLMTKISELMARDPKSEGI